MIKNKNLLIISNYTSKEGLQNANFVKEQVDIIKKHFNKVIVISPTEYFPKFLAKYNFIPKKYSNKTKYYDYKYDNVEIYYPRYFTLPFNYFRNRNGIYATKVAKECIRKNKINFDLIHAHFTYPQGFVAKNIKKIYNKRVVLTVHENRNWFLEEYNSHNKNIYDTWKNCDLIIRVNKKDVPLLKKYNEKAICIPNGVNSSKFTNIKNISNIKNKLDIPKDKKVLLNVGSYKIHHKNQINLIKAISKLAEKRSDIILYLIGSGKDRTKIENKIKELNLKEVVKVIGTQPHNEIPLWMNAADLFVLPSYSEGNPTVLFEALGCGLPYIGTNVGGVGEIINTEEYGLIYDNPEDYIKLAKLIKKGINRKWEKEKIKQYSLKFEWNNIVNKLINEYQKLLINYE